MFYLWLAFSAGTIFGFILHYLGVQEELDLIAVPIRNTGRVGHSANLSVPPRV